MSASNVDRSAVAVGCFVNGDRQRAIFFLERNKNARYINIQMERMKYYLHRLLPPEFRRVAQMAEKKIDRTITSIHLQSEFFNLQSEGRTHWLSLFLMPSMKPLLMQPSCIQPLCRLNNPAPQNKGSLARKWAFITSLRERYNHDNTRPCCWKNVSGFDVSWRSWITSNNIEVHQPA